jgi:hypothetical protein
MLPRLLAACVILLFSSVNRADDTPKSAEREAVLAELKANKVSLSSLNVPSKDGGPVINLSDSAGTKRGVRLRHGANTTRDFAS